MKEKMDLSIVIVSYNSSSFLRSCIKSVSNTEDSLNKEIIVVDNTSRDDSVRLVKLNFPSVRLIENNKNVGFAKANNIGIKLARGRCTLFLNPDIVVRQNALDKMINFLKANKNIGIIGPKLLYPNGNLQLSCRSFYNIRTIILRRTFLAKLFPNSKLLKHHLMLEYSHDKIQEVDWVFAACLMVRREVLNEVGYFDEGYRMYFEDVDLCYRMKKAGYKVCYYPEAVVTHHHRRDSAQRFSKKTIWHIQSAIRFFNKYGWKL